MISFSANEREVLTKKLQDYLATEHTIEIGRFDAEFFLDFITREFGAYYYNHGLRVAQAVVARQVDSINDAIYELEKPTEFDR